MAWEFMESTGSWRFLMAKSRRLSPLGIRRFFAALPEPRQRRSRIRYPLLSLIVIAICASVSGANTTEEIALFARTHRDWLARIVELPEDPGQCPAQDTFDRVFAALDVVALQKCLLAWLNTLHENIQGLISIDGKVAREAMARAGKQGPLTLVSAWASANHLLLGQVAGAPGSSELEAVPRLLELLALEGAIVTLDALSCQQHIVEQIVEQGGDYVIAVKGNQPKLAAAVHKAFEEALLQEPVTAATLLQDDNKGRREQTRCYVALPVPTNDTVFQEWSNIKSLAMVTREYTNAQGEKLSGTRYFISSLQPKVKPLAQAMRCGQLKSWWNICTQNEE
jgi:predicted transposase YbfD/YdcC